MQPLSPGMRRDAPSDINSNPLTPLQTWEAAQGTRSPQASSPPRIEEVRNAKAQIVMHRQGIAVICHSIDELEVALSRLDPQAVIACDVPGYTDPPERVAAAERDKAAGFVTDTPDIVTVAASKDIQATKQHIAQLRAMIQHTETHNDFLEHDLSLVAPECVCVCHVVGYADHPATIARAAEAANIGD